MDKFKKTRFASKIVVVAIVFVILYVITDIIMFHINGSEPNITPFVFGFFGGELTLLAAKRIFTKSKKEEDGTEDEENNSDKDTVG